MKMSEPKIIQHIPMGLSKSELKDLPSEYIAPVYKTRAERLFQQQMGANLAEDIAEKADFREEQLAKDNAKL